MKEPIIFLAIVVLTISAPASANGPLWDKVEHDQAIEVAESQTSLVQSLLRFRSDFASAAMRCDREWLHKAYDPSFQLVEGSGWITRYEGAVRDCKYDAFRSGWNSKNATGVQVRLIAPDAAVVTGTTKLSDDFAGIWVRWTAGYVFKSEAGWVAKFAQEHRVPAKPPGPPVPPQAPRGFNIDLRGPAALLTSQKWEDHWAHNAAADAKLLAPGPESLRNFRSEFLAAVRNSNQEKVRYFYAPDFTITHGSGYVEGRETRVSAALRTNARLPELVDGPFLSSTPFGSEGVALFQALPFIFPGGASGYIRALTILDRNPNQPENYRIRAMIINSFDWGAPSQRIPSGCEPPPLGSPVDGEPYPNCASKLSLGRK